MRREVGWLLPPSNPEFLESCASEPSSFQPVVRENGVVRSSGRSCSWVGWEGRDPSRARRQIHPSKERRVRAVDGQRATCKYIDDEPLPAYPPACSPS